MISVSIVRLTLALAGIVACGAASRAAPRGITLVTNGQPRASIVVPDRATPAVRYAAHELQDLLREMSGAELPIRTERQAARGAAVLIGPCKRAAKLIPPAEVAALKEDGVILRMRGSVLALDGRGERGRLYSVYVLLERLLGVRFLARDCTLVPKRRTVALPPVDYRHSPPFMYRETLYFDSFPKQIAARQRLNGPTTQCDANTGGKIAIFPYVHSAAQLVPLETYYADHPEYFSLVGGKRSREQYHTQLCLTNPNVLRIASAQVMKWIEEKPEVPIIDVSQNDGDGACECEKCAAVVREEGSQHGPILRFVNAIAGEVARKHPDKWIETLAYAYSTKPPAITKPLPNVIIRLCHGGCYFHGFEKCGLGANYAEYIAAWHKLTDRIFIWHYATNFAHYLAPCQNLDGLQRDIRYYAAHGVNGLMVQADYQSPGGDLSELRQYLAAQLMWDPSRDPIGIREEFCAGYYGAAAEDVLAYLALLDRFAGDQSTHAFGAWDPSGTVPPAMVAEGLAIVERARQRSGSPDVARRVDRLVLPLWYMQLSWPDRYALDRAKAPALVAEFRRIASGSAVTHVREGGESMSGWLADMEKRYPAK